MKTTKYSSADSTSLSDRNNTYFNLINSSSMLHNICTGACAFSGANDVFCIQRCIKLSNIDMVQQCTIVPLSTGKQQNTKIVANLIEGY